MMRTLTLSFLIICTSLSLPTRAAELALERIEGAKPLNVIFILSDDHRYDVMSFLGHPWVETPAMDAMAKEGVYFRNAMVTTSLCSPSRASILTGQYMHNHGVVDNNVLTPKGTVFFPQYLQAAGYQTGYFGKWHMGGHSDAPRPGFDKWVSFRGQGHYYPPKGRKWSLNIDGKSVPQKGYITDELTDYALEWLAGPVKKSGKPFFVYLSHKGVHGMFHPAKRHAGRYKDKPLPIPTTMANTPANYKDKPMWLKNQRNSWHGVDFAYHQATDIAEHYRLYCEALLSVDDSIARVRRWLKENDLTENTLVFYMGDNGFQWGEHGLIDKRTAYQASMRVPLLGVCPSRWKAGQTVDQVVANIDIGPTILEAAGLMKFNVRVGIPQGYEPETEFVEMARSGGATVTLTQDAQEAVAGADIVVTDTWISMGQEHVHNKLAAMAPFQVSQSLMGAAKPDAKFLHCLPAHVGEEVSEEVFEGEQSVVFDEAENRIHAQKSVLLWCFDRI